MLHGLLGSQRDTARSKGEAALAAGEAGAAAQHFSKAVGVTHDMAFALIKVKFTLAWLYFPIVIKHSPLILLVDSCLMDATAPSRERLPSLNRANSRSPPLDDAKTTLKTR